MMQVKTESGSIYSFATKKGKLIMAKGLREYHVESIQQLGIGLPLIIEAHTLNPYNNFADEMETTRLISTNVVEIRL